MKSRSHRLPTISDTPDDWVDESWTVDCVCGVNFDDGEEMVDCDECGVWVHTRCSRYVKSEKLFACDKCKSKKLRKESEETEVAQLLVELPTKTLRMENPYAMSYPPQNSLQVLTDIPLEEKVHVQGVPGGDPALFGGVSSVFSSELWKCTGYVPKKFNFQYREFPCWDERRDDDDNKGKEEIENHASKGADALFSLSKEIALPTQAATFSGMKTQVNGGCSLDMGPPTTDTKKQDVENYEGRRQHNGVRKERSLPKPVLIHSGNQKKDDSRVFKDLSRKKTAKPVDREGDKKRDPNSFESVSTMSSDAKQSESYEGKGPKVFKTDKQSCKHENSRADLQANHKSDSCLDMFNTNNHPFSSGLPSENIAFDDSRLNPSKEAKQMEENDGNQVPPSVGISPQTEDGMASSLKHNSTETITMKDEDVDDANGDEKSCSRSNGTWSNTNNLEKLDSATNGEVHATPLQLVDVKAVEINHPGKTTNSQIFPTSDIKLDSSKTLTQNKRTSDYPLSASLEVKKEAVSVSQTYKVQNVDKSLPHVDSQAAEPDESPCGPSQSKGQGHIKGAENSIVARSSSELKHGPGPPAPPEAPSKSHGTVTSPSGAPKETVSTVTKSSVGKPSSSSSAVGISKPSVVDKARYSNTDDCNSSGKQKGACDNNSKSKKDNASSEMPRSGDACEKPKKLVKDLTKSLSTSAIKSSHMSKSSHAPVPKKNSSDTKDKDPAILSSSKTSSGKITAATPDSGDSANSLRYEGGAHEQSKSTSELSVRGEKINQVNRQPAPKNNPPHVHAPMSTNIPATLSDEELALLLHQELNSSPRVPRVPRMRHAGSLPHLASSTSTSTLMKRTSTSGGRDNGLVSRKKNKESANNGPSSREFDGAKKADRLPSLPNSRRHDLVKHGSAKAMHHLDKTAPPASATVSSCPSSSNEANEHNMSSTRTSPQNASDDETGTTGVTTHRTLPGLIAEIMSKGKRMAYEELCNAVLPHWPNLRKQNGERYAYSSHSQAVLDCLRNRSEWSRLVDRGPKTNAGRKRRKSEADAENPESEEDDYSTDRNTKDVDSKSAESQQDELPKRKQRARKHRRLALQGRGIKDVRRRRRKAEVLSDDIDSSDSSEESAFSDEGGTSAVNEASASSDEMGTM